MMWRVRHDMISLQLKQTEESHLSEVIHGHPHHSPCACLMLDAAKPCQVGHPITPDPAVVPDLLV